ncbi:MAG: zinc ribbon domain-containing protein [Leptospira sp.]|nr:zinc ribbon domain-containing protein [Leptospira sp.]
MPIYEYECLKCGKSLEALQPMSRRIEFCSEITSDCSENGSVRKKLSMFAYAGSGISPNVTEPAGNPGHTHSGGCGCFGTNSCPSDSVRTKYGLD